MVSKFLLQVLSIYKTFFFEIFVIHNLDLPEGRPKLTGGKITYRPGDLVHLNCSAPKSRPATNLTWFINEQQVLTK